VFGQTPDLLALAPAGEEAFEKLDCVPELLDRNPKFVSFTHRQSIKIASVLEQLPGASVKHVCREFSDRAARVFLSARIPQLDPFQHIDKKGPAAFRVDCLPGAFECFGPPGGKLPLNRLGTPPWNDVVCRPGYLLLDENIDFTRRREFARQPF